VFTVILLSDWALERFGSWKELFDPFINDRSIALCDWNQSPGAKTLTDAVPGLKEVIKGKREWRLLVIGTGSEQRTGSLVSDPENPFDFKDNLAKEMQGQAPQYLNLVDSAHPIIRLTHMVLGYPEMGVKSFEPDPSFRDPTSKGRATKSEYIGKLMEQGHSEIVAKEMFLTQLPLQHDVRMQYREQDYSPEEKGTHKQLSTQYSLRQERPLELVLLAPREPTTDNPRKQMRKSWELDIDSVPTRFVERNDYPSSCRFGVFDLETEDHTAFEIGEFKFWLSVLTLATNNLPASSFQAERLHEVSIELDGTILADVFNQHLSALEGAKEKLESLLKKRPKPEISEVNEILKSQTVVVPFDKLNGDDLRVTTKGYGLATDLPNSEFQLWSESYEELQVASSIFARQPRRVLSRAVIEAKSHEVGRKVPDRRLERIERDELEQELANRVSQLAKPATTEILNKEKLSGLIEAKAQVIRSSLSERMSRATILGALGLVIAAWMAGLLPYFISAWQSGSEALIDSLIVGIVILSILLITGFAALVVMRWKLVRLLHDLNSALKSQVNNVKLGATNFGHYLTQLNTYMFGRAIFSRDNELRAADERRDAEIMNKITKISARMDSEKEIVRSVDRHVLIQKGQEVSGDLLQDRAGVVKRLFLLNPGHSFLDFNDTGDMLRAPYEFVTGLNVTPIPIFDQTANSSKHEAPGQEQSEVDAEMTFK
jgi:hypothetical protein